MRHKVAAYLDSVITLLLLIVAGFTPLLFFSQTTEFFQIPKLVFLLVMTTIILGVWVFSWIVKGKVVITRTPLDIPLLLLLAVVILSTFFSLTRFTAIYGNFPNVHGSAVSWVVYILLYFVTVSHLKTVGQLKTFLYVLYASAFAVAIVTLLSFFNVFLPVSFARSVTFTPTGSSFSTIAFLLMLLPLPLISIANQNKYLPLPAAIVLASLFSVVIVLIGSIPSLVALLIAFILCVLAARPSRLKTDKLVLFLVPVIIAFLALALAYVPFQGNVLQSMEANFPKEIQLPFAISWKVTASAFRDAPFIGTGPSSYLFNFTTYKPAEFNALPYWNFSFDTAYDEFLQLLGTLGILGLLAVVIMCLVVVRLSWKSIAESNTEAHQDAGHLLSQPFAISGLLAIVLLAIHATTLVSIVVTFFVFAVLVMSQKSIREKVTEFSMGIKASTSDNKQFDLFPIIIFIVFLVAAVPVLYRTFNAVAADYYHRQALSASNKNGTETYQMLQKAEQLNPQIDLYRVDIAQTNFALANALAVQKGPTKANPKGSLTDQDKQTIQTLLSQAVTEGRVAVALSPRSSRNWEVLAAIYRNISGVAQNALAFSLDGYGRAIQLDPLNPTLRINVGGIYYLVKNYDMAIRFFSDAANLKSDYVIAYYNLAIALRDKGDLQNAVLVANQAVNILAANNKNSVDYKTAVKLLDDLKAKLAAAQKAQQTQNTNAQQAPAAQTNSALSNQNISNVNVSNLNNPPKVTPAPSVKPNPSANLPQVTAAPTRGR
jgi:tetratricopeptide (TPR) repeat protein